MLQMFDTREIEMRAKLGERRVDLVPPLRGVGTGWLTSLTARFRTTTRRAQASDRRAGVPSVPCP